MRLACDGWFGCGRVLRARAGIVGGAGRGLGGGQRMAGGRMAAVASSASSGRFRRKHPIGQRLGEVGLEIVTGLGPAGDVPLGPQ